MTDTERGHTIRNYTELCCRGLSDTFTPGYKGIIYFCPTVTSNISFWHFTLEYFSFLNLW